MFFMPCGSVSKIIKSMNDELTFKLIRELDGKPGQSQRLLSETCGVSLGSVHYCLKALIDKGFVKVQNFKNSDNKIAYAYIVTPSGFMLKKKLTVAFLKRKQKEYEKLKSEIQRLEEELNQGEAS